MTNPQLILDRLTAWVEKQSSVGPAAFRQALAEIRKDIEHEERGRLDSGIAIQHEAFETAKHMLTANPVLRERLWRWLNETAVDHVRAIGEYGRVPESASLAQGNADVLAQQMGEFARGPMAAAVDAAIAADKEHERAPKPKKRAAKPKGEVDRVLAIAQAEELARFCDKHGVDRETVARRIYP